MSFGREGGYRVLSQLANHWCAAGNTVDFLVPAGTSLPYFPTQAGILWTDRRGNVARKEITRPKNVWLGPYQLLALHHGLTLIGANYDVVLANQSLTAWPVRFANCSPARKYYYIQAYEPEYYALGKHWGEWVLSALSYRLKLNQITNSPIYFGIHGIRAREFVPPGIDLSCFFPKESLKDLSTAGEIVIGCIGRREPSKGTRYVLEAFENLAQSDSRFRLRVAYGNLPKEWEHSRCEIVVPANDAELAAYYRSLDILVAPGTVQHGAPHYPVMEAMACGVPVVTTGYMPATPKNSWIVTNHSAKSIISAILDIVSGVRTSATVQHALTDIQSLAWEGVAGYMLELFANGMEKEPGQPRGGRGKYRLFR